MADALNAFLHFSFLQSKGELVFADLQGMSSILSSLYKTAKCYHQE